MGSSMKAKRVFNITFITGLSMGVIVAVIQGYFEIQPPEAYGICLVGHPRDAVNLLVNNIAEQNWPITDVFIIYPTMLAVGTIIGAYISSEMNREFHFRAGPVRSRISAFIFGFLVINFGLLWGSCPIRTGLLVSYGNVTAIIVLTSMAVGAILACLYVKLRVKRSTPH
jgi:hypothetical protein